MIITVPKTTNIPPHQRFTTCISLLPVRNPYDNNKIPIKEKKRPITKRRSNNLFMAYELKENNIKYQGNE
jgi:hypothetical protein